MKRFVIINICAMLCLACSHGPGPEDTQGVYGRSGGVGFHHFHVKRLPDMNVPRAGHVLMYVDGTLTAFGGHTTGFVRSASAEYFSGGRWHLADMNYAHDGGFAVRLPDGRVMLGGGSGEDFGVGQSYGVEVYAPGPRRFTPLTTVLDIKRAYASGLALPDGRVVVSGNWWTEDAHALFSAEGGFVTAGQTSQNRCRPFLVPDSGGDVLVFGGIGNHGDNLDGVVDRMAGDPFKPALSDEWGFSSTFRNYEERNHRIDDSSWLFQLTRKADGAVGFMVVSDGDFALLPTTFPVPSMSPEGESITWSGEVLADRNAGCAWISGNGSDGQVYFLRVDYAEPDADGKVPISVWNAERLDEDTGWSELPAALSPEGYIAVAGGIYSDNFFPKASAFMLSAEPFPRDYSALWQVAAAMMLLCAAGLLLVRRKRESAPDAGIHDAADGESEPETNDLYSRIISLIEDEQLFLKKDLRVSDIAERLGTNGTYISAAVNKQGGMSFNDLVTRYRIGFAQRLMIENPEEPLVSVMDRAGFSSESAFYRNFRAVAGCSPSEWRKSLN